MPRIKIDDGLPLTLSRQRRYQLRKVKAGLCRNCAEPRVTAVYCREHADRHNVATLERYYAEKKCSIKK